MSNKYEVSTYRSLLDILSCWTVIFISIGAVIHVSWWLYPIAFVLIANRILALSLICHEGLHGNISKNRKLNDFLGRYLCAFPSISFSKYRRLHILHHSGVGSEMWDPDRHLYSFFPINKKSYFTRQLKSLFSLKMCWSFLQYYTEVPEFIKILKGEMSFKQLHKSSDLKMFLVSNMVLSLISIQLGLLWHYLLFYVLPLVVLTQPYVLLMGGLQHGPPKTSDATGGVSRTITGSPYYMWLLLPLDINYHAEHHYNPKIPHYHLKEYSKDLKNSGIILWRDSYKKAAESLFGS